LTDEDLRAWADGHKGIGQKAWDWSKDNWEYIVAGVAIVGGIALMCTGVGGPAGIALMAASGALISGGTSAAIQKHQNGSVDWARVGVDAAVGALGGAAGGAVAGVAARAVQGMSCLGRNVFTGVASGMADGGVSGGLSYVTSGQPLSVSGFVNATAQGAAQGGALGGAGGGVSGVSRAGCFDGDTEVLMGDGSMKAIQDVTVGEQVTAFNPDTGELEPAVVTDTQVHEGVATFRVTTTVGEVVSTVTHPFYVQGKGYTPVSGLEAGDRLLAPDGALVEVVTIEATGKTQTVHNLKVKNHHNYHVKTGNTPILVHNNGCGELPQGSRPPNLSPEGAGRSGAFRQAKRDAGIPMGQQPLGETLNEAKNSTKVNPGRVYQFTDPAGGPKPLDIRDDILGHKYKGDGSQDRGPHFNGPDGGHYDY
jgi:hypothetical protein